VILGISAALILIVFFLIIKTKPEGNITSASILNKPIIKCVSPEQADDYINKQGCERIRENPECESEGKIEIKCRTK